MQKTWVWSLDQEDPLEKETAIHSSILSWRIPLGRGPWQATVHGVARVGHDLVTNPHLGSLSNCSCCSLAKSCPTLCDHMHCNMPSFPVLHYLLKFVQTHVHWVGDVIQPSHPLLPPSLPGLNLSQHQGLFQWVRSSHQVAKVLEPQHQSFEWIFRIYFL